MQVDNDGTVVSQGQGGRDGGGSSSSNEGSSDEEGAAAIGMQQPVRQSAGPVIDEDGFQLVQKRRPRGAAGHGS